MQISMDLKHDQAINHNIFCIICIIVFQKKGSAFIKKYIGRHAVPEHEEKRRGNIWAPAHSPTMAGDQ